MFDALYIITLFLAVVSASVVPRASTPPNYAVGYLEEYSGYHLRYIALGCQFQHGKKFFDECCHPLLATETLAKARGPQCVPSSAALKAAEHSSKLVVPLLDDGDCDDDEPVTNPKPATVAESKPAVVESKHAAPPASKPAVVESKLAAPPASKPAVVESKLAAPPASKPAVTPEKNPATVTQPKPAVVPAADPPAASTTPNPQPSPASSNTFNPPASTFSGFGTFFFQKNNAGACGIVHQDTDTVVALDSRFYNESLCGKKVEITNTDNKSTVIATVADECPTCRSKESIDMSTGTFQKIADPSTGMINISWRFV